MRHFWLTTNSNSKWLSNENARYWIKFIFYIIKFSKIRAKAYDKFKFFK